MVAILLCSKIIRFGYPLVKQARSRLAARCDGRLEQGGSKKYLGTSNVFHTVTRLNRQASRTRNLLDIAACIEKIGADLRSLTEPWADTTAPAARRALTVFAVIAEFERSLIIDRTRNGREAAKARGVKFSPPYQQIGHDRHLADKDDRTVKEAASLLGVHRPTL